MNVDVLDESGGGTADVAALTRLCRFVMRRMRLHPATELTVRLVDADTMAVLNEKWMGHQGPTDVLSFPMDELRPPADDEEPPDGLLGDIVLCPEVTSRQAAEHGRTPEAEAEYLLVHGLLHLLGYDHATPDEKAEMFGLKDKIIAGWAEARRRS